MFIYIVIFYNSIKEIKMRPNTDKCYIFWILTGEMTTWYLINLNVLPGSPTSFFHTTKYGFADLVTSSIIMTSSCVHVTTHQRYAYTRPFLLDQQSFHKLSLEMIVSREGDIHRHAFSWHCTTQITLKIWLNWPRHTSDFIYLFNIFQQALNHTLSVPLLVGPALLKILFLKNKLLLVLRLQT